MPSKNDKKEAKAAARADGVITKKEEKQLQSLGIKQSVIDKPIATPSPTPSPSPSPAPSPVAIGKLSYSSNTPQAERKPTYTNPTTGASMTQAEVDAAITKPAPTTTAEGKLTEGTKAKRAKEKAGKKLNSSLGISKDSPSPKKLGAALSIAGTAKKEGNYGKISSKEALGIMDRFGLKADQLIKRVDQKNERRVEKGKSPIYLGSNFANKYKDGKLGNSRDLFWNGLAEQTLGQGMDQLRTGDKPGRLSNAYNMLNPFTNPDAPDIPKGQLITGTSPTKNGDTVLNTMPNRQTPMPASVTKPAEATKPVNTANDYTPTPLAQGPAEEPLLPVMQEMPNMESQSSFAPGGMGAALNGGATSFKRRKSSARSAGLTTKGTGQFKILGQSGRSSGLNIGYSRMLGS